MLNKYDDIKEILAPLKKSSFSPDFVEKTLQKIQDEGMLITYLWFPFRIVSVAALIVISCLLPFLSTPREKQHSIENYFEKVMLEEIL